MSLQWKATVTWRLLRGGFTNQGGVKLPVGDPLWGQWGFVFSNRLSKHTPAATCFLLQQDGNTHVDTSKLAMGKPDFPCAAIKVSKNNPCTLTITALAGAEFYLVKQNLHRHCNLSLPVSPSRHKTLMSPVECAKNGKKSWRCLTQSQVGPVLTASQFPVEQVCIGLQTVC